MIKFFRYLISLLSLVMILLFGLGLSEFLERVYVHRGSVVFFIFAIFVILFIPITISVIQNEPSLSESDFEKIIFAPLNILSGGVGVLSLAFFYFTAPDIDAFFQGVGLVLSILILFCAGKGRDK